MDTTVTRRDEITAVREAAEKAWGPTEITLSLEHKPDQIPFWRVKLHHSEDAYIEVPGTQA